MLLSSYFRLQRNLCWCRLIWSEDYCGQTLPIWRRERFSRLFFFDCKGILLWPTSSRWHTVDNHFLWSSKQISLSLWQRWEREITMMMLSRFRSYMRSSRVYTPWVSGTTCAIKSRFLLRSHFTACLFGFFHSEVLCDRGRFPLPS